MSPKSTGHNKASKPDSSGTRRWDLANGSLVVMQGNTQENWRVSSKLAMFISLSSNINTVLLQHEIPKQPKVTQGRISLTFRQLINK